MWCAIIIPYLIYPTGHAAIMMTIYTIVVLSFERLHAICSPLTHIPIFWPYLITIFFSAITIVIPLFFHYQLVFDEDGSVSITVNPMYENETYNTYFHAGVLIIGNLQSGIKSLFSNTCCSTFMLSNFFRFSTTHDFAH